MQLDQIGKNYLSKLRELFARDDIKRLRPYLLPIFFSVMFVILKYIFRSLFPLISWPLAIGVVEISSWYGGGKAALLATMMTATENEYFVLSPSLSKLSLGIDNLIGLMLFIGIAILINAFNTRLRNAQQVAMEVAQQAETASRSKDLFFAMISHELRTPLNAILSWVQLLRSEQFHKSNPNALKEGLQVIERNVNAQAQLIDDLLDLSRLIKGRLRLQISNADLGSIINSILDSFRPAIEVKAIHITKVLDQRMGLMRGDPNRLQQVIWNLLSNAIKYTPQKGEVEIRLEQIDSQAQITVKDNGVGIDPKFLPYIFDCFRQEKSAIARSQGGLGLGLTIARFIVKLHGGTIDAQSPGVGSGATFIVKIPLI
jgi:signal transduction histidine kinase